ncbi:hypothetical protein ACQPWY_14075 [Pseudonocardia xinjiangensis]|uniref:hypothetical protein n=1 Tax=Pseudonocardia xinjiangensis TaxID=75289 RepID=UPI003D9274A8
MACAPRTRGWSHHREAIISGSEDHTMRVWDANTGQQIGKPLTGHTRDVFAVALGKVGGREIVVSGSRDLTVRMWDANTGQQIGDPLAINCRRHKTRGQDGRTGSIRREPSLPERAPHGFSPRRQAIPTSAASPQIEMLMGGSLDERKPPIMPSGRQDLNLRPLDPSTATPTRRPAETENPLHNPV